MEHPPPPDDSPAAAAATTTRARPAPPASPGPRHPDTAVTDSKRSQAPRGQQYHACRTGIHATIVSSRHVPSPVEIQRIDRRPSQDSSPADLRSHVRVAGHINPIRARPALPASACDRKRPVWGLCDRACRCLGRAESLPVPDSCRVLRAGGWSANIPVAGNRATADFMICSPLMDRSHQGRDPASGQACHNREALRVARAVLIRLARFPKECRLPRAGCEPPGFCWLACCPGCWLCAIVTAAGDRIRRPGRSGIGAPGRKSRVDLLPDPGAVAVLSLRDCGLAASQPAGVTIPYSWVLR
jgi:hypothetical protein